MRRRIATFCESDPRGRQKNCIAVTGLFPKPKIRRSQLVEEAVRLTHRFANKFAPADHCRNGRLASPHSNAATDFMRAHTRLIPIIAAALLLGAITAQAKPARYYKWQGVDRVICAQTSPGEGWTRLKGSYIKSDCSI
jgi:hypothetical protein